MVWLAMKHVGQLADYTEVNVDFTLISASKVFKGAKSNTWLWAYEST